MNRIVPNFDPVGNDYCLTPIQFEALLLFVDNGCDCYWFHELITGSSRKKLTLLKKNAHVNAAYEISIPLILPSASAVRAHIPDLDRIQCSPARILLTGS